jgi:hypothetical protein
MKRIVVMFLAMMVGSVVLATPAWAGAPHFVDDTVQATIDGNSVTVVGKEAGLGDEAQITVTVTADAACINPGGNHPKAANKESFSTTEIVPVQNGKANFEITVTATFSPECVPPMSVAWSNITVFDETNGLSVSL